MTLAFLIYFVAFLGKLSFTLWVFFCGSLVATVAAGIHFATKGTMIYDPDDSKMRKATKGFKYCVIASAILLGTIAIVPSEKTAWLMLGGFALQEAYESEEGAKIRKIISRKIDEALEEEVKDLKGAK